MKAEEKRLEESIERKVDWKLWGCYISERAWGTVREDYSADGSAWTYFPFEQTRSKAYRWNEDGIAGICDRKQRICFALSLWNGKDKFLKERLFGLGGDEGVHGEDVKEYYFYLDNTPTHSYMKYLYKYPQPAFPYEKLHEENSKRDKSLQEYELMDTGVFDDDKYFDIFVEYAKADVEDICIKITAVNHSSESAPLHILPTVWFRNRWSWYEKSNKPQMEKVEIEAENLFAIRLEEERNGVYWLYAEGSSQLLFTENDTNFQKIYNGENKSLFVKDGINDFVVNGKTEAVNPRQIGTKAAAHYILNIPANSSETIYLRLSSEPPVVAGGLNSQISHDNFIKDCEQIFQQRIAEADVFYADIIQTQKSAFKNIVAFFVLPIYPPGKI